MSVTNSPNMSLPIPGVGTEPGPDYATDVNASLTILDGHSHTPGSGVAITPAGLNINTALTLNDNFLTAAAGLTLTAQSTTPAIRTLYTPSNDLYFVDGLGNNIQITANGGIAGTPGSIANLAAPASASYVSGSATFVFQSDTNIAGNIDVGTVLLRNLSPNSTFAISLQAPTALSSNYNVILPSLPSVTSFLTITNSGAIAASAPLSLGIDSSMIAPSAVITTKIADLNVTTVKIADDAVTQAKIPDGVTGLVANYFPTSSTMIAPDKRHIMFAYGVGGGGGGGGGGATNGTTPGGGGGGGGGAPAAMFPILVTPGETITVVLGSGGTGGSAGNRGSNGGDSYISCSSGYYYFRGGIGGNPGNPLGLGTGGAQTTPFIGSALGGAGGGVNGGGQDGYSQNTSNSVGGTGGTSTGTAGTIGGGGGGGGAGVSNPYAAGPGANGANGTGGAGSAGSSATTNSGGGGGGGAGAGSVTGAQPGGAGGNGGNGFVALYW